MFQNEYGKIEYRTDIVDTVQSSFGCCGASGPSDWAASKYNKDNKDENDGLSFSVTANANRYKIPQSCCINKESAICRGGPVASLGARFSSEIYSEVIFPLR